MEKKIIEFIFGSCIIPIMTPEMSGNEPTAEELYYMWSRLPIPEQKRFLDMINQEVVPTRDVNRRNQRPLSIPEVSAGFYCVLNSPDGKQKIGRPPTRFKKIRNAFYGRENDWVSLTYLENEVFNDHSNARKVVSSMISLLNTRFKEENIPFCISSTIVVEDSKFETYYSFQRCRAHYLDALDE